MKTIRAKLIGIFCVLLILLGLQAQVFARNEDAPGLMKKEAQAQTAPEQTKARGVGNSNNPQSQQSVPLMTKEIRALERDEAKVERKLKKGVMELRGLLEKLSSDSSRLDAKFGKLTKVKVRTASSSAQMKRHGVSGVITEINGSVITLVHQIHRERVFTVIVDDLTTIAMKGKEVATLADLAVGQRIAAVGTPTASGLQAKRVHVIPGKATGVFERNPLGSPSGTITTTPSVIVTTTPTVTVSPTLEPTATPTP